MTVLPGLNGVIRSFGARMPALEVERRDGATYDQRGIYQEGTKTVLKIKPAVVQPATERQLLRLPEGDRSKETITIHTIEQLRTARAGSGQEADIVLFREPTPVSGGILKGRYVVVLAGDWQLVAGFTSSMAQKIEGDAA